MPSIAAGPFRVGERVRVAHYGLEGEITEVGETQTIRAYGIDVADPEGEIRHVTTYSVLLDNGQEVGVADRDGHIVRA